MPTSLTDRQRLASHLHRTGLSVARTDALLDAYRDQVRDQALTEAAEMLRNAKVGCHETDGVYAATELLLATSTGQAATSEPSIEQPQPKYSPADNLRDYANALTASNHPDAAVWADALNWASGRVRGGHGSLFAHRSFRQRFDLVAEHCGVGPWDGIELGSRANREG